MLGLNAKCLSLCNDEEADTLQNLVIILVLRMSLKTIFLDQNQVVEGRQCLLRDGNPFTKAQ